MLTKVSNDYEYLQASLNTQSEDRNTFKDQDPFYKSWEQLKDLMGLDNNFKRRTSRNVSKMVTATESPAYLDSANAVPTGVDGVGSKQINPGTVYRNGYGFFDVITPPYNMYELANFYDTSFANHAAIDAKVENVVGLGYRFEITDRTLLNFEMTDDEGKVERARSRIERGKIAMRDWLESLNNDDSFVTTMTKVYTDVEATGNGFIEIGRTWTIRPQDNSSILFVRE